MSKDRVVVMNTCTKIVPFTDNMLEELEAEYIKLLPNKTYRARCFQIKRYSANVEICKVQWHVSCFHYNARIANSAPKFGTKYPESWGGKTR